MRIRELYQKNAPVEEIQKAYDELHSFILQYGVRGQMPKDGLYKVSLSPIDRIFLEKIGQGKSVLEIGVGDGFFIVACNRNMNTTAGIDISQLVVDRLRNIVENEKLNIRVSVGDARQLEFADGSFDFVVSKDLIEHIPAADLQLHLSEVWRVLKPNGCYLVWTPSSLLGPTSLGAHLKEYSLSESMSEFTKARFNPTLQSLYLFMISKKPATVPNKFVLFLVKYEAILKTFLRGVNISNQQYLSYLIVPPICIAAYKKATT